MKRRILVAVLLGIFFIVEEAYGQDDGSADLEKYIKSNIALGDGRVLGVSSTNYVRCLQSVNYAEPGKRLSSVEIDRVVYMDDGTGYDLVAEDGIMTSNVPFSYQEYEKPVPIGEYRLVKDNFVVHDPLFEHDFGGRIVVEIACDVSLVTCSQGGNCLACQWGIWPHGCVRLKNCRLRLSWEW